MKRKIFGFFLSLSLTACPGSRTLTPPPNPVAHVSTSTISYVPRPYMCRDALLTTCGVFETPHAADTFMEGLAGARFARQVVPLGVRVCATWCDAPIPCPVPYNTWPACFEWAFNRSLFYEERWEHERVNVWELESKTSSVANVELKNSIFEMPWITIASFVCAIAAGFGIGVTVGVAVDE